MIPGLRRLVPVREHEVRAFLCAALWFACLLTAYFLLRPVRESWGTALTREELASGFLWTFLGTIVTVPSYFWLVSRVPRHRFVPWCYRIFSSVFLVLLVLWQLGEASVTASDGAAMRRIVAKIYFPFLSIFGVFVVSLFWSVLSEIFRAEQAKRLFAGIAAGGTLGGICGSAFTATLAEDLGTVWLLLLAILLLEAALFFARRLFEAPRQTEQLTGERVDQPVPGTILTGLRAVFVSPYLIGICLWLAAYTASSTALYFEQRRIVIDTIADPDARTSFFAVLNLCVQSATLLLELCVTSRVLKWLGVGAALCALPFVTGIGFALLHAYPTLTAVLVLGTLRSASEYGMSKPAREVLWTVVGREAKYKAKNFIDVFVYRGSDALSARLWKDYGSPVLMLILAPLALLWMALALGLGRRQNRLASHVDDAAPGRLRSSG